MVRCTCRLSDTTSHKLAKNIRAEHVMKGDVTTTIGDINHLEGTELCLETVEETVANEEPMNGDGAMNEDEPLNADEPTLDDSTNRDTNIGGEEEIMAPEAANNSTTGATLSSTAIEDPLRCKGVLLPTW